MDGARASDEVIDEIALIAMLRHEADRHGGGLGSSGTEALRKLNELRDREQKAMQEGGPKALHQANLDALAVEIRKVQQMSGGGNRHSEHKNSNPRPRPQQQQQQRKEGGGGGGGAGGAGGPHNPSRNKGRRNTGRQGRP